MSTPRWGEFHPPVPARNSHLHKQYRGFRRGGKARRRRTWATFLRPHSSRSGRGVGSGGIALTSHGSAAYGVTQRSSQKTRTRSLTDREGFGVAPLPSSQRPSSRSRST